MPDFTPLELDVMRLLAAREVRWLDLDHIIAGLEAMDGGEPADRAGVLSSLSFLSRSRLVVRRRVAIDREQVYALTALGAAELAARDAVRAAA